MYVGQEPGVFAVKACSDPPFCAFWLDWESQGCSATCGQGMETFTRKCLGAGECVGESTKQAPCKDLPSCECKDNTKYATKCAGWSGNGYCTSRKYARFITTNCKKSCNLCPNSG